MSPEDLSVGDWEYEDKVVVHVRACDNVARVLVNISTVKKNKKKNECLNFLRNRLHFLCVCLAFCRSPPPAQLYIAEDLSVHVAGSRALTLSRRRTQGR